MFRLRSLSARYGLSLAVTALASLLYFVAGPPVLDSDVRYFGFVLAVLVAALLAGLGPGLLATVLSACASAYLLLQPVYSFEIASHAQLSRLILFSGEGVLLSFVGHVLRDADTAEASRSYGMRYLSVLLFVSTATCLKLLAFGDLERALPFTFFYAAIAASAWVGGLGPGLAATLLSSLTARFFFLLPRHSLTGVSQLNAERLGLFLLEGILISALSAMYPRARRLADQAIEQMRQYSQRTERSMQDIRALRLTSKDLIWEWDPASNRVTFGATEAERTETSIASMSLSSWLQRIHPEDRSAVANSLNSALREHRDDWVFEYRKLQPNGKSTYNSDHAYIIRNVGGDPIRVVGRSADVTEAKRVAHASGMERRYRALFEQSPLAILVTDEGLHVTSANRAASDVLGYGGSELKEMRVETLFQPRRRDALMEALLGMPSSNRSSIAFQEQCVHASGKPFEAKINAGVISHAEDGSTGWVIMIEELPSGA
jgi:PAS domain S-box-containing protein